MSAEKSLYRPFGAMRLFLAVLVMLSHGSFLLPSIDGWLPRDWVYGPVAVFVFFVISGFVITEAVLNFYDDKPVQFFVNRLLRLYPTYALALGIACIALLAVPKLHFPELSPGWADRQNLFANLFSIFPTVFLMDWLLGVKSRVDLISVNWALRVEFAFYMVVAAIIWLSKYVRLFGLQKKAALRLLIMLFLGIHIYFFYLQNGEGRIAFYSSYIPYFVMGVVWALRLSSNAEKHWAGIFFSALILAAAQAAMYPALSIEAPVAASMVEMVHFPPLILWSGLIGLLVLLSHYHATRGPLRKFDVWAGDLSYPVYLMHMPALYFVANQLEGNDLLQFGVFALLTLFLAWSSGGLLARGLDQMRDKFRGASLKRGA